MAQMLPEPVMDKYTKRIINIPCPDCGLFLLVNCVKWLDGGKEELTRNVVCINCLWTETIDSLIGEI
jgi:ssDNA-binding Zn-finger/Zn-ribbon topoisomerase 1